MSPSFFLMRATVTSTVLSVTITSSPHTFDSSSLPGENSSGVTYEESQYLILLARQFQGFGVFIYHLIGRVNGKITRCGGVFISPGDDLRRTALTLAVSSLTLNGLAR